MNLPVSKRMAATALSLALLGLAGCSAPEPDAPLPPPPPPESYYTGPPNLAGGPAQPAPGGYQQGLAGGPGAAPEAPAVISMAPIANPEDLPQAERHRIYGDKYDHLARSGSGEHRRARRAASQHAEAPAAAARQPAARPAPAAKPSATKVAPTAKAPATPALDPAAAKLQAAVGPQVSSGAVMTLGAPLSERQPGAVSLTLPQTLFDVIRKEASKLGLGRATRSTEVTATLSGDGYQITPNGAQTVKLKPGEAPAFQWQVAPGDGQLGALSAKIAATLNGQRKPVTIPLATITKASPVSDQASGPAGSGDVNVPGLGKVPGQTLLGGGLILLAVILLIALARNAAAAKEAARRRRSDRLREVEANPEPSPEPPPVEAAKPKPGVEDPKA